MLHHASSTVTNPQGFLYFVVHCEAHEAAAEMQREQRGRCHRGRGRWRGRCSRSFAAGPGAPDLHLPSAGDAGAPDTGFVPSLPETAALGSPARPVLACWSRRSCWWRRRVLRGLTTTSGERRKTNERGDGKEGAHGSRLAPLGRGTSGLSSRSVAPTIRRVNDDARSRRFAGWCGVAFFVLSSVIVVVSPFWPPLGASAAEIVTYHRAQSASFSGGQLPGRRRARCRRSSSLRT